MVDTFFSLFFALFDVFESDELGFFILGFCMLGLGFSMFRALEWGARS